MDEKRLEKKLREEIKKLKGIALKFSSQTYTGFPDRIVLTKRGQVRFVELKTRGKKPTELQKKRIELLKNLGFKVYIIDDEVKLNNLIEEVRVEIQST